MAVPQHPSTTKVFQRAVRAARPARSASRRRARASPAPSSRQLPRPARLLHAKYLHQAQSPHSLTARHPRGPGPRGPPDRGTPSRAGPHAHAVCSPIPFVSVPIDTFFGGNDAGERGLGGLKCTCKHRQSLTLQCTWPGKRPPQRPNAPKYACGKEAQKSQVEAKMKFERDNNA